MTSLTMRSRRSVSHMFQIVFSGNTGLKGQVYLSDSIQDTSIQDTSIQD